ncbi:hypothetical protein BHM03_00019411 [Ensete ventricosum]|nr:hypothetical protein BHM03_00019411 [Ensete ventricosum]
MRVDGTSGPLATDVAGEGHAHSTTRRSGVEGPGECENRLISGIGGSSIPDPVVHPLPAAALKTKPIASS